jgi:hypothetical protein
LFRILFNFKEERSFDKKKGRRERARENENRGTA